MYGLLILVINATMLSVPIASIPYVYSTPLEGCGNFSAYLDPLTPWGISAVYVVSINGSISAPVLNPYPSPKYVSGHVCGDYLTVKVDRWMPLGPLIGVSISSQDSAYIYSGIPLSVNGTAIVKIKSLTPPKVEGGFYFKTYSSSVFGVYVEEYVVYGNIVIEGYGIANITYISLGGGKPDYYVVVPATGVRVEGVRPWSPDVNIMFAPNQTAAVGRPRVAVEQITIPVVGECNGTAVVVNPLERPLSIYLKLETGEEYVVSSYLIPKNVITWRIKKAVARTADGQEIPAYAVSTSDGSPVGLCAVEGEQYYVYVNEGDMEFRYPAVARGGEIVADTDLVRPKVDAGGFNFTVSPTLAKLGSLVEVRLYLNGTEVATYKVKAAPTIALNISSLYREVRVVDLLGSPIPSFVVYVRGLKFVGSNGVARVVPIDDRVVIQVGNARYLVSLDEKARIPTLTPGSFAKLALAALAVGAAAAFGLKGREEGGIKVKTEGDIVDV